MNTSLRPQEGGQNGVSSFATCFLIVAGKWQSGKTGKAVKVGKREKRGNMDTTATS